MDLQVGGAMIGAVAASVERTVWFGLLCLTVVIVLWAIWSMTRNRTQGASTRRRRRSRRSRSSAWSVGRRP